MLEWFLRIVNLKNIENLYPFIETMQESTQNHKLLVYKDFQDIFVMQEINCICKPHFFLSESVHNSIISTVVSHIYTYDRAQNILNFVQQLQKLIL